MFSCSAVLSITVERLTDINLPLNLDNILWPISLLLPSGCTVTTRVLKSSMFAKSLLLGNECILFALTFEPIEPHPISATLSVSSMCELIQSAVDCANGFVVTTPIPLCIHSSMLILLNPCCLIIIHSKLGNAL